MEKEWKAYEIGELDQYLFGQGNHYEIYKKLGAHMVDDEGQEGVYFAVWPSFSAIAPLGNSSRISILSICRLPSILISGKREFTTAFTVSLNNVSMSFLS